MNLKELTKQRDKLTRTMYANSRTANALLREGKPITEQMESNDRILLEVVELDRKIGKIEGTKIRVI